MIGKYGSIIGTIAGTFGPMQFADSTLGFDAARMNSIIGKSVVIHGKNGTRIGCANILMAPDQAAKTSSAEPSLSQATLSLFSLLLLSCL